MGWNLFWASTRKEVPSTHTPSFFFFLPLFLPSFFLFSLVLSHPHCPSPYTLPFSSFSLSTLYTGPFPFLPFIPIYILSCQLAAFTGLARLIQYPENRKPLEINPLRARWGCSVIAELSFDLESEIGLNSTHTSQWLRVILADSSNRLSTRRSPLPLVLV